VRRREHRRFVRLNLLDIKQLFAGVARNNEVAHVCISQGNCSGEWGSDFLETLQVFEPFNIGFVVVEVSRGLTLRCLFVLCVQVRHHPLFEELLPLVVCGLSQVESCLSKLELVTSLLKLLIQVRCIDFGQQLPRFNVRTDIHEPLLEIATGLSINRRFQPWLDFSW